MTRSSRREFLRVAAGAAACSVPMGFSASASAAEAKRPPNVVFILADDLGWGDLGCYGSKVAKTPSLDRLAAEGIRFLSFYVNSPVCSPTRTGFMTGRYPSSLRIHAHFATAEQNDKRGMPQALDPSVTTLADCMRGAGYATGHFGKWHLGDISPKEYGIDQHRVYSLGGDSEWEGTDLFWQRSSELIADETIAFIKANRDKPFYVNMWTHATHAPLDPSSEQMKPFNDFRTNRVSGSFTTPHAVYNGVLNEMDRNVGRVLAQLDELGLRENTIVIFSSDNGPEDIHISETSHSGLGNQGPFRGRKRSLYEGGVRTPFIVRWPGHVPAGGVDDETLLSGVDFLQTVATLCGVKVPGDLKVDGEDMSQAWSGTSRQRTKPLFWERRFGVFGDTIHMSPMMAMRAGKWKLLMNPDHSRIELYDIPSDPMEVDNRADTNQEIVKEMSAQLIAWHESLPESPIAPNAGAITYVWPEGG